MSSATGAGIELDATGYRADNHTAIPATHKRRCAGTGVAAAGVRMGTTKSSYDRDD